MDSFMRCNSLKCRTELKDRAVVTTCSHIFCETCSQTLPGLTSVNAGRVCPACKTQLSAPDDAVVTSMNPSEDYKTSVLSGMSPTVIMECAGRGLAFYSYQTSQEIIYQAYLAKSLTDKYSKLSSEVDKMILEANSEITGLREQLSEMQLQQKNLEQKNSELQDHYRKKAKACQQIQTLYTKLKQKGLGSGLEIAAEHEADHAVQAANQRRPPPHSRSGSGGSGGNWQQSKFHAWEQQQYGAQRQQQYGGQYGGDRDRAGLQSAHSAPQQVPATPSGHRTRLPQPLYANQGSNYTYGNENTRQGTPRQPLVTNVSAPGMYGNYTPGYGGMSAGVKVGRQNSGPILRNNVPAESRPGGYGGMNMR